MLGLDLAQQDLLYSRCRVLGWVSSGEAWECMELWGLVPEAQEPQEESGGGGLKPI